MRLGRFVFGSIVAVLFLAVVLIKSGLNLYVDWLWFSSVGYLQVFWTSLYSDIAMRAAVIIALFLVFLINLLFTKKEILHMAQGPEADNVVPLKSYYLAELITGKRLIVAFIAVSAALALLFSSAAAGQWLTVQKFLNSQSFGVLDPLFNMDLGFYIFELPFYRFAYSLAMTALVITTLITAAIYFFTNPHNLRLDTGFTRSKLHLSILISIIFLLKAAGYRLAMYALVQSGRGVAYGASYTDVHAQLPALKILSVIALAAAILVLVNVFLKKLKWVAASVLLLVISSVVLGSAFPALMQQFIVEPDELRKETPYLEHNIAMTRKAFNLESIDSQIFPLSNQFEGEDINANKATLDNVRIWDWRPLLQTYSQLQEIQPYYNFGSVDIDRYMIDGQLKQVMLSARELNQQQLPQTAQTWINKKLRYTHGYGAVVSPSSVVTEEGLPAFYVKDMPPKVSVEGIEINQPQVYFGEQTDSYVFVGTKTEEFDFPGSERANNLTSFKGDNGIRLGSFIKRALLAIYLSDFKVLLAGDLSADSQLLLFRNINQRLNKIMPFLTYDSDPYLVIAEGKLFWIRDAYTVSSSYPYSEPINGVNYIRNSVKVVVDAYDGSVNLYAVDTNEPVLASLSGIFPGTFKDISEMPESLVEHLRYPEDLFMLQAQQYAAYHMTDPQNFYNKEDMWSLPSEIVGDETTAMQPYYTVMKLPGEEKTDYLMMLPFTPFKKLNMASWLAVRNSPENYGEMIDYRFPRDRLVFGPMQVEARIDQDSDISSQLTLWDQRGSEIIRGNLIVIPIEDSILYVEPIFLQGEQSRLPELRRVVVTHKDTVVMGNTFSDALQKLFTTETGADQPPERPTPNQDDEGNDGQQPQVDQSTKQLIDTANQLFNEAQDQLRQGDFGAYGDTIQRLEEVLQRLQVGDESNQKDVT